MTTTSRLEEMKMGEQIKKKFLLYFRLMLLVWIVIANAILHVINLQ